MPACPPQHLPTVYLLSRCPLACPRPFRSRAASDILTHTPPVEQASDADGVLRRAGSGVTGRREVEASDWSLGSRPHTGAPERDRAERARSWAKGIVGRRVRNGLCGLLDLDGEILSRLWPAERVVAGQNACKYLRMELRKCGRVVLQACNTLF